MTKEIFVFDKNSENVMNYFRETLYVTFSSNELYTYTLWPPLVYVGLRPLRP